jgi:hypothetical protein
MWTFACYQYKAQIEACQYDVGRDTCACARIYPRICPRIYPHICPAPATSGRGLCDRWQSGLSGPHGEAGGNSGEGRGEHPPDARGGGRPVGAVHIDVGAIRAGRTGPHLPCYPRCPGEYRYGEGQRHQHRQAGHPVHGHTQESDPAPRSHACPGPGHGHGRGNGRREGPRCIRKESERCKRYEGCGRGERPGRRYYGVFTHLVVRYVPVLAGPVVSKMKPSVRPDATGTARIRYAVERRGAAPVACPIGAGTKLRCIASVARGNAER